MSGVTQKRHGNQLIALEVLVYRGTISEPTPWSVSIDTYLLVPIKLPVF